MATRRIPIQNIQPLCPNAKMKLILDSYTKLDEIPTDYTKFDGNVSGFALLFIDSETCTEEEFHELKKQSESFLKTHKLYFNVRMFYEKPGYIDEIDDYNFSDYFFDEYCIFEEDFDIDVD